MPKKEKRRKTKPNIPQPIKRECPALKRIFSSALIFLRIKKPSTKAEPKNKKEKPMGEKKLKKDIFIFYLLRIRLTPESPKISSLINLIQKKRQQSERLPQKFQEEK